MLLKHLLSKNKAKALWTLEIDCDNCKHGHHETFRKWFKCNRTFKKLNHDQMDNCVQKMDQKPDQSQMEEGTLRMMTQSLQDFGIEEISCHNSVDCESKLNLSNLKEFQAKLKFLHEFESRLPESISGFHHVITLQKIAKEMMEEAKDKLNMTTNDVYDFES